MCDGPSGLVCELGICDPDDAEDDWGRGRHRLHDRCYHRHAAAVRLLVDSGGYSRYKGNSPFISVNRLRNPPRPMAAI